MNYFYSYNGSIEKAFKVVRIVFIKFSGYSNY